MKLLIKCKENNDFLSFYFRLGYTKTRYIGGILWPMMKKIALITEKIN